jgi:hypothetical protein
MGSSAGSGSIVDQSIHDLGCAFPLPLRGGQRDGEEVVGVFEGADGGEAGGG